jgi:ABC transport system ATP-binding/permease protein
MLWTMGKMSLLVNGHQLSKGFAGRNLFKKLSFGVSEGQHIGLIGPNGAGKSTLLKIIFGTETPDEGTFSKRQGLRMAYLAQVPVLDPDQDILTTVLDGADDPTDKRAMAQAYELISKLAFDEAGMSEYSLIGTLSGGWQKKVALAREFMKQPDLLLLDEPTNHLDVDSILWLEEFLARTPFATLTITHDRLFLNRISNRIWELDPRHPNGLLEVDGDYATFCQIKEEHIHALERREEVLKNTLRRETEWLRRGPAARTTKQNARMQRAYTLSDDVENLENLNRKKNVGIEFSSADGSPKKILEAKNISKSYDGRTLFENFSLTLQRGQRIALLGANGAGKSTLIKILLGYEKPDTGEVEHSERLQVAYFDQKRDTLDPQSTPIKTLCPQGDHVQFRGSYVHIRSYLDRFLFGPDLAKSPISKLSGGEQARLLIAKLMLQEANLLVLDEPTNDLDLATLNVLEAQLRDFEGAILLVTHDRYFMDQVVDQIYAPYEGKLMSFADIGQWEAWVKDKSKASLSTQAATQSPAGNSKNIKIDSASAVSAKKLTYKDQREFDQIEATIAKAEAQLVALEKETQKPENASKLAQISSEMALAQSEIERLYARWSELEALTKGT